MALRFKEYSDYWDWYDNGPGSESWKKELYREMGMKYVGFPWDKVIEDLEKDVEEKPKKVKLPEELFDI